MQTYTSKLLLLLLFFITPYTAAQKHEQRARSASVCDTPYLHTVLLSFVFLPVGVTSSAGEAMTPASVSTATLRARCGSAELVRVTR